MTLEKLAMMVQGGFEEVHGEIGKLQQETNGLRQDMTSLRQEMTFRLDRIENVHLLSYQNQIDQLRDTVLRISSFVKLPPEKQPTLKK